jgi:hypothetical protein
MVNQALEKLSKMAIFKMSLGSKELFHSNFLEFLWDTNYKAFIGVINNLLGKVVLFPDKEEGYYTFSREKENFDICIYHKEKKQLKNGKQGASEKTVYDVIIENKVKSIPCITQLNKYEEKVKEKDKEKNDTEFLLLSLVDKFEDKTKIERQKVWEIVSYNDLSKAIEENYKEDCPYIKDYCDFIREMHNLQQCIAPGNFLELEQELFDEYEKYKHYRLHDLYIKCRGLKFIELLKKKLDEKKISYEFVKESGESLRRKFRENQNQAPAVYLNWNVFNAEGQIAVFIHKGGNEIYEIVVQGAQSLQYRHGINYVIANNGKYKSLDNDKKTSQSLIWNKVKSCKFMQGFKYPEKNAEHCGYGTDYIYRYDKVVEKKYGENIESLLNHMVDDIGYFVKKFKCK